MTPALDTKKALDRLWQGVNPHIIKLGFLGLGNMGQAIVKKLLSSGHQDTVYNMTYSILQGSILCQRWCPTGINTGRRGSKLYITFSCVADPFAAKEVVYGKNGVLCAINDKKGFVEMTSIDPETSLHIS